MKKLLILVGGLLCAQHTYATVDLRLLKKENVHIVHKEITRDECSICDEYSEDQSDNESDNDREENDALDEYETTGV